MTISPSKWRVGLPIYPPGEVTDNSTRQEYIHCFRKGFYRYGLRRGFQGKNFPIQFGLAYHKYRETVEDIMREKGSKLTDEIHDESMNLATAEWEDPPIDHPYHSHLDLPFLVQAMMLAKKRIVMEQQSGSVIVMRSEDSFDVELPFWVCSKCGWATFDDTPTCQHCKSQAENTRARAGGRIDQFLEHNKSSLYIRDFKTTGWCGAEGSKTRQKYVKKYDPNNQIQGYVWAGSQLSGRRFNGGLIEVLDTTKTRGPDIFQIFVDFSKGQMEQWLGNVMMHEQFIRTAFSRVEELGYLAFPQNTDHCTAMGVCGFMDACRMGSGREIDNWLESMTVYSHWDFTDPDGEADSG